MLILGFDSTAIACSAALIDGDKIISEIHVNRGSKHSEQLLPMIDDVLRLGKKEISDLDAIAVATGPGSFTGVRIAVATGKALGQGLDKKLISVSSLDALANNVLVEGALIVPLLDARKNEFYTAWYRYAQGTMEKIKMEYPVSPSELFEELQEEAKEDEKIYFFGEGISKYEPEIKMAFGERAIILPVSYGSIKGSAVALLALEKYKKSDFSDYFTMAPYYLRKPEAETTWEAKQGGR